MPALGSNINAALGRIDYSPIARGGEIMARGIANAGAAQGQGIAALGAGLGKGIGDGIAKWQQNKAILANNSGKIDGYLAALQQDPSGVEVTEDMEKMIKNYTEGKLNVNDTSRLVTSFDTAIQAAQQKKAQEAQAAKAQLERDKLNAQIAQAGQTRADTMTRWGDGEAGRTAVTALNAAQTERLKAPAPVKVSAEEARVNAGIAAFREVNGTDPNAQQILEIRNGAAQAGVTQAPASENAFGTSVGKGMGERLDEQFGAAETAMKKLPTLYNTLKLIKEGKSRTGITAEILGAVDRVVADVFNSDAAREHATDQQLLNAATGSGVFELIQSLGIGARGMDTPAERDFLREVMTGKITLTKEALIGLTEKAIEAQSYNITQWNDKLEQGTLDPFYESAGIPKSPFIIPEQEAAGAVATRRWNQETGQLEDI